MGERRPAGTVGDRDTRVLLAILQLTAADQWPTARAIGRLAGIRSTADVHKAVRNLAALGLIVKEDRRVTRWARPSIRPAVAITATL